MYPKACGNEIQKNLQGQQALDEILYHPGSTFHFHKRQMEVWLPGKKRGISFFRDLTMKGFLEP